MTLDSLQKALSTALKKHLIATLINHDELTLIVAPKSLLDVAKSLRDSFHFEQLIDVAGVDYLEYPSTLPSSAREEGKSRFAVVYHLLSYTENQRVRVKCFLDDAWPEVHSLTEIWPSANWFEREAFDLFGVIFKGHPDLRRILTDYGFIGHPFRKDFPLIGTVEMRYDAAQNRVIYDEVEITPRILVPRVIRQDNRYEH